jgi:hypothetical protein
MFLRISLISSFFPKKKSRIILATVVDERGILYPRDFTYSLIPSDFTIACIEKPSKAANFANLSPRETLRFVTNVSRVPGFDFFVVSVVDELDDADDEAS